MFNRKSLTWLLVITVFIAGCGTDTGNNADGIAELEIDAALLPWIEACEADYQSTECRTQSLEVEKDFLNISGINLFASILPYEDYENSSECLTDPKGDSCQALLIMSDSQIADLKCETVEAFGPGYFCWAQIIVRNIGSSPIDDYIRASLYDVDGNQFAADVEGSFEVGVAPLDLARDVEVQLNPEKVKFIAFGFSVPDNERQFRSISLSGNDVSSSYEIRLCRKNSGEIDNKRNGIVDRNIVIYEDASLLNSCRFDFENYKFINRLDGSVS